MGVSALVFPSSTKNSTKAKDSIAKYESEKERESQRLFHFLAPELLFSHIAVLLFRLCLMWPQKKLTDSRQVDENRNSCKMWDVMMMRLVPMWNYVIWSMRWDSMCFIYCCWNEKGEVIFCFGSVECPECPGYSIIEWNNISKLILAWEIIFNEFIYWYQQINSINFR